METDLQSAENFPRHRISGFVLAGGKSSRLGRDKVLLPWNGRTLLQHTIERLRQVCGTIHVCAGRAGLRVSGLLAEDAWIPDAVGGAGPLGGIVAALEQSPSEWNFFLAVDLPLIPVALLRALASRAGSGACRDTEKLCVLPTLDGYPQPLCGIYHRALAPALRGALLEGKFKVMLALREALAETKRQPESVRQPAPCEPAGANFQTAASGLDLFPVEQFAAAIENESNLQASEWFLNINTPAEWQLANELAGKQLREK